MAKGKVENRGRRPSGMGDLQLLSLWADKEQALPLKELHAMAVNKGWVTNISYKASTKRKLDRLVAGGYLSQPKTGHYKPMMSPKPFSIIEVLKRLQQKYGDSGIYEWHVGGWLSTLAEGTIFGLPQAAMDNEDINRVIELLLVRMANLYSAIEDIISQAQVTIADGKDLEKAKVPKEAIREYALEILPYIIGNAGGIDGDGLPLETVVLVNDLLTKFLPKEAQAQPIWIDGIKALNKNAIGMCAGASYISERFDLGFTAEDERLRKAYNDSKDVALVIHPSRQAIDEAADDRRRLYDMIRDMLAKQEDKTQFLGILNYYDEATANYVLGLPDLGLDRSLIKWLKEHHHLMRSGRILDSTISTINYLDARRTLGKNNQYITPMNKLSEKEVLDETRLKVEAQIKKGHCIEDMITGLWFSNWPFNTVPRSLAKSRSRFDLFDHKPDEPMSEEAVANSVERAITAIGLELPPNFRSLLRDGKKEMLQIDDQFGDAINKQRGSRKPAGGDSK